MFRRCFRAPGKYPSPGLLKVFLPIFLEHSREHFISDYWVLTDLIS